MRGPQPTVAGRAFLPCGLLLSTRSASELPPLDLAALSALHFEAPDLDRFPCISLAYRALNEGGTLPAAMNAANEEAVGAFIQERIGLTEIPHVIEAVMNSHSNQPALDIETILEADRYARLAALSEIEKLEKTPTIVAG